MERGSSSSRGKSVGRKSSTFKMNDAMVLWLFKAIHVFIITHEPRTQLGWYNITETFLSVTNTVCKVMVLKNKYESMRPKWKLWTNFRNSMNEYTYIEKNGVVHTSESWWQMKLEENAEFKRFKPFGYTSDLIEYMELVYDSQRLANPNLRTPPPTLPGNSQYQLPPYMTNQELENNYIDMDRFNNMGIQEQGGLPFGYAHASGSTMHVNAGSVSMSGRWGGTNKSPIPLNSCSKKKSKNKGKPSNQGRYSSGSSWSGTSGHEHMGVIESMVASGHLVMASSLWCFAVSIIAKSSARSALTSIRTNHGRKVWLEYEYDQHFPNGIPDDGMTLAKMKRMKRPRMTTNLMSE